MTAEWLAIASDPLIAERYSVGEPIASGGFAKVFKGLQTTTGQAVAIKVLELVGGSSAPPSVEQIERFRQEMRLCAELHHPNIVPLIDSGETSDGRLYAVFTFVPGWNLADVLTAEGALEPAEALHLMAQVIDAISSAHAKGIVHRDLKPGNVMLNTTGARRNALVLDFGIGAIATDPSLRDARRLTRPGEYLGTPFYSAPEQLRGEAPTVRSDLYAWGLIFLECLTGEVAMGATTPNEVIHRHLSPDPVPIPDALEDHELGRLLRLVTEKSVERRSAAAADVLAALQRCARQALPSREAIAGAPRSVPVPRPDDGPTSHRASRLSPIWSVPLGRNPKFTGREDLLRELAESVSAGHLLAVVALHGMGGVGKTQLALEYAYRYADRYRLVAWIRAEKPETLAADYCALATPLEFPEMPNQRQRIEAVRSWLEQSDHWLLIFDNAPNPEAIRSYLPRSYAGHIVVTSRHTSWRDLATSLAVEVLDQRDAVDFLLERTGETDPGPATELSEELGRLPLALEEAAAYIEATGRSISTYLRLLRSHRGRLLLGDSPTANRPGALRTTWELSFRQLEREAPQASDLLDLCAFLAPEDIPFELVRLGARHLPERLRKCMSDEVSYDACVAALQRYSLVKAERDGLLVHRLVQLATAERLPEHERESWIMTALRAVEEAYPQSTLAGEAQPESGRLLPHALAVLSHASPYTGCPEVAGRLLRRTGIYMSAMGLHDRAADYLEKALRLFERAKEPDDDQVALVLWERGMVLHTLGEADAASDQLERSLQVLGRVEGSTPLLMAQNLMMLSWARLSLGEFEATLDTAQRSLEIVERILGTEHPLLATSLGLMGRALWSLNRMPEARRCAERGLDVLGRWHASFHPLTSAPFYHISRLRLDVGELDSAIEAAEKGIELAEQAYGPDHPLVSLNLFVRGSVLLRQNELQVARSCFEHALESGQRSCHHLHEDIALCRSELANVLRLLGDIDGARASLERAFEGAPDVCGDRSRLEGHARMAQASLLWDLGDALAARARGEAALHALDARFGVDHPARIPALNLLGWILRELGEAEQAESRFAEAIRIAESAGLDVHPDLAESLEGIGVLSGDRGDRAGARASLNRALALLERSGRGTPTARRVRRRLRETGSA